MRTTPILACVLVGCATPYQARGVRGGYLDWQTGNGRHHIEVRGNAFTDYGLLRSYFHRRAIELCVADGFPAYQILAQDKETTVSRTPESYNSRTSCDHDGCVSSTHASGGSEIAKGTIVGEVVCVNG